MNTTTETTARPLNQIAFEIRKTWPELHSKGYAAVPYVAAMSNLESLADAYGQDSGLSIVLYFLSNATSWRGNDAKRIKAELKAMIARFEKRGRKI